MPDHQIFYDPGRKRWKRLRRIIDATAVITTLVLAGFIFNMLRNQPLPELLLPTAKHNYKALSDRAAQQRAKALRPARRKTTRKPSEIPLNSGEGLRAAYYVPYDEASYSSFKQHVHQIDMLFPEWLHVESNAPVLLGIDNETHRSYPIIDRNTVHDPDDLGRIKRTIQLAKEDTEIFPHINNYNSANQTWDGNVGVLLGDEDKRAALRAQIMHFLAAFPAYHGISLDFESLPDQAIPAYTAFVQELYGDLHARNLRLYVTTAAGTDDTTLKALAANSDGIVLMNYDEHEAESDPGPIASQSWFMANLQRVLKSVPKDKLICALGNYGYDWTLSIPPPPRRGHKAAKPAVLNTEDLPVSDAWQRASDSDADLDLDYDSLNPHFAYIDEDNNQRHVVWFLDGVTLLNEMRAARELGLQTFALWRLGTEDSSLWNVWDRPTNPASLNALGEVAPGHEVDNEGEGDIMRVTGLPQEGKRTVQIDTDEPDPRKKLIIDEHMDVYPQTYTVQYYGYHPNEVAISFDDGPDPKWTPRILDVLDQKNVKGTFFVIGEEALENIGILKRELRDGDEIGNHTYTHPDISEISPNRLDLEVKLTERLFASKLGVQPLYFRPPYDIDEEPDTDDQAAPVVHIQQMGFIVIGNKIDTDDWNERMHKTPQEIAQSVLDAVADRMKAKPQFRGSIILLHDGGGDRSVTVAALPVLINTLREHGYTFVPVSTLMGKTTVEVMPALTFWQRQRALPDSVAFSTLDIIGNFLVMVFFVGDVLMSARLIIVGLFAVIDRLRRPHRQASPGYNPRVAVLMPAYNEEKVIVRTVRSVLNSDYKNLHVIVIDDGSTDLTWKSRRARMRTKIAAGRSRC